MSDTPTANPQGDENDDPLAELESIVVRSAQRFEPESTAEDAELAYYLETKPRKPRSGGHPAPPRPAAPAPQNRTDPHNKDFRGSSEDEFEAAFRSLEKQTASAPVRQGSVFEKEPVFEEPPPKDYSRTSAQSFEEEMAGSPGTSAQEFETRADAFDFDTRFVTVIAITGLVFVAVIGALIYSWVGATNTGEPISIKADTSPVKKMAAAETEQPSGNKLIYDRLSNTDDGNNEKIASRQEQPVDNLQAPDASSVAVPAAPASPPQASSTTPRVILPNPSAQETGTLNAPRQVPTTTIRVRPDGTMANIPSSADTMPAAPAPAAKTLTAAPAAQPVVPTITTSPVIRQPSLATPAVRTATPSKPVTKPQAQPPRMANVTSTTPSTVPSSGSGFVVQVSSQKSQDSARASFSGLQARFPQVLAGYQPSIKAVTLGGHGTYYRVRVGPVASRDKASVLCGRLKAAGGDCIVVRTP
jgi:cell division septation protein DedD